nr:hypothetical protein CFP56_13001 [Quercus suber]
MRGSRQSAVAQCGDQWDMGRRDSTTEDQDERRSELARRRPYGVRVRRRGGWGGKEVQGGQRPGPWHITATASRLGLHIRMDDTTHAERVKERDLQTIIKP